MKGLEQFLAYEALQADKAIEQEWQDQEVKRFLAARKKLTAYQYQDQPVYLDRIGHIGSSDDHRCIYSSSVVALQGSIAQYIKNGLMGLEDLPNYCWACQRRSLNAPAAIDIAEGIVIGAYQGAIYDITAGSLDQLQAALDAFVGANKHVATWEVDYSAVVLLEWSWLSDYLGFEESDRT
jgi:hypothetical protein